MKKKYILTIMLLLLFLITCCNNKSYAKGTEMFEIEKKYNYYIFTIDNIRNIIKNSYNIDISDRNNDVFIKDYGLLILPYNDDRVFIITNNGVVKKYNKKSLHDKYIYKYIDDKLIINSINEIQIEKPWTKYGTLEYDRNSKIIVFNFSDISDVKKSLFKIVDLDSNKIILQKNAYIGRIEYRSNILYFNTIENFDNNYVQKFYKYNIKTKQVLKEVTLNFPKNLNSDMDLIVSDIDVDKELLLIMAIYNAPYFSFQKSLHPHIFIYDIKKEKYITSQNYYKKKLKGKQIFAFFMNENLKKVLSENK